MYIYMYPDSLTVDILRDERLAQRRAAWRIDAISLAVIGALEPDSLSAEDGLSVSRAE